MLCPLSLALLSKHRRRIPGDITPPATAMQVPLGDQRTAVIQGITVRPFAYVFRCQTIPAIVGRQCLHAGEGTKTVADNDADCDGVS